MGKRYNQILEMLCRNGKVEVSKLAEQLGVSQVTIRKDLDELEVQGFLMREHGYAVLRSDDGLQGRIAFHYEDKRRIVAKAAELIAEGSSVMIETGSCCAMLAEELVRRYKELTIITNSMCTADFIRFKSKFQVVLLGGIFNQSNQTMVGPLVKLCAENFCVDYLFIGVDGYSDRYGFSKLDHMNAQAIRDMACQADKVVVLGHSGKFLKMSTTPINLRPRDCILVTDGGLDPEVLNGMQEKGITVLLA